MKSSVAIHGDGIAACCCAYLLQQQGIAVSFNRRPHFNSPTLLINRSTQQLITDVFGDETTFSDLPTVQKRIVFWGSEPELATLPHYGIAISESVLLDRLWAKVKPSHLLSSGPEWSIYSTPKVPFGTQQQFGSRMATSIPVQLKETAGDTCWIESLDEGWLFLLPCAGAKGSLVAVGSSSGELLAQSRLIAQQIECEAGPGSQFLACPRIRQPLCGANWLACGSSAMGFDPVCGEGAGHAVREAILAVAALRAAIASPASFSDLLAHYSSRLLAGFLRHLTVCRQFYVSARRGNWWDAELASLDQGIGWTRQQLAQLPQPQFRLDGFSLAKVCS
jgi:hypothetical protein